MKLLFDQNISSKIVRLLEEKFPSSTHVLFEGLENAPDLKIFNFAKKNGYAIVTFDSDFVDLSLVKDSPPKIIWLRSGNLTTTNISRLLLNNSSNVQHFLESKEKSILEINR